MSKNIVPCGGFELGDSLVVNDGKLDLAPGAGGGLPTGEAPYQQLVTDGDGKAKWEDRLAYETEPVLTEIVPEETVTFSDMGGIMGASWPSTFNPVYGSIYTVKFDGNAYNCAYTRVGHGGAISALGNLSLSKLGEDTGEPFLMICQESWVFMSADSASEHTISISGSTSVVKRIDHKFLPVATEDTYGVVKKSEIVSAYEFPNQANQLEMNKAIDEFGAGRANIVWGNKNVIRAFREGDDTICVAFSENPTLVHKSVANNGKYVKVTASPYQASNSIYISSDTKIFRITVNDSGAISTTEVTT